MYDADNVSNLDQGEMIETCLSALTLLLQPSCPFFVQAPTADPTWLGPVLGAAVGAFAAMIAAVLSFVAMSKASRVSVQNIAQVLVEKYETRKRKALSDLLAFTYQIGTPEGDARILNTISYLKLLIRPSEQSSKDLLNHLDEIFAKSNISDWRKQFIALSLKELE